MRFLVSPHIAVPAKRGTKEDLGSYRPDGLTSVPGRVKEQRILDTISKRTKDKKVMGSSQHGFPKGKSCLANPTAVDDVYLDHSTAFDAGSQNTLPDKLMKYGLDRWAPRWAGSRLSCRARRVAISRPQSSRRPLTGGAPQGQARLRRRSTSSLSPGRRGGEHPQPVC